MRRYAPRVSDEQGSAMLLIPAAFLIVALFVSVTLDAAQAFLMQRELAAAADAMANDAVASLDVDAVTVGGTRAFDQKTAKELAIKALSARSSDLVSVNELDVDVKPTENNGFQVTLKAQSKALFGKLLHPKPWRIQASARVYPAEQK